MCCTVCTPISYNINTNTCELSNIGHNLQYIKTTWSQNHGHLSAAAPADKEPKADSTCPPKSSSIENPLGVPDKQIQSTQLTAPKISAAMVLVA